MDTTALYGHLITWRPRLHGSTAGSLNSEDIYSVKELQLSTQSYLHELRLLNQAFRIVAANGK